MIPIAKHSSSYAGTCASLVQQYAQTEIVFLLLIGFFVGFTTHLILYQLYCDQNTYSDEEDTLRNIIAELGQLQEAVTTTQRGILMHIEKPIQATLAKIDNLAASQAAQESEALQSSQTLYITSSGKKIHLSEECIHLKNRDSDVEPFEIPFECFDLIEFLEDAGVLCVKCIELEDAKTKLTTNTSANE